MACSWLCCWWQVCLFCAAVPVRALQGEDECGSSSLNTLTKHEAKLTEQIWGVKAIFCLIFATRGIAMADCVNECQSPAEA